LPLQVSAPLAISSSPAAGGVRDCVRGGEPCAASFHERHLHRPRGRQALVVHGYQTRAQHCLLLTCSAPLAEVNSHGREWSNFPEILARFSLLHEGGLTRQPAPHPRPPKGPAATHPRCVRSLCDCKAKSQCAQMIGQSGPSAPGLVEPERARLSLGRPIGTPGSHPCG
jgi:hypothetical protein